MIFQKQNDLILNFYSEHHYKEILKYWEETIQIWHIFNQIISCEFNQSMSGVEKCVENLKEKWENGIDNFDKEIHFITNNIDQFIERKEEKCIKHMPIEIDNIIIEEHTENLKVEWIKNIEGKKDILESRLIKY